MHIDLSSEFSGGMYAWFGEEWPVLKEKVLAQVNIKIKQFEDMIDSDISKIEEVGSDLQIVNILCAALNFFYSYYYV